MLDELITVFENGTGICFVDITMVLEEPMGWSWEVCLHTGTDWLKLICQRVARGQFDPVVQRVLFLTELKLYQLL